jgi:hypothetical protein
VTLSGGGKVVESENASALAEIAQLFATFTHEQLHEMGQNAQDYYQKRLALEVGVARFGEHFKRLASSH